jgi:hypothetical protein
MQTLEEERTGEEEPLWNRRTALGTERRPVILRWLMAYRGQPGLLSISLAAAGAFMLV